MLTIELTDMLRVRQVNNQARGGWWIIERWELHRLRESGIYKPLHHAPIGRDAVLRSLEMMSVDHADIERFNEAAKGPYE